MKRVGLISLVAVFVCSVAAGFPLSAAEMHAADGVTEKVEEQENEMLDAVKRYTDGNYAAAVSILSDIIAVSPENDAANYYMALSKIALGETDVAEVYLERAAELDPGNFWYRSRLAAYYGMTSRTDKSIALYRQLLKEFPKKSQIYYDLFELYVASKKNDEALDVLDSIEDVFGPSDAIVMQRFKLLLMMERQEEAIGTLQEYNKKYTSPFVLTTLADYEMSIYNDSLAHKYYDEVLDLFPDYAPAMLGKAEAYRLTRKDDAYFKIMDEFVSSRNISSIEKKGYLEALVSQSLPAYLKVTAPRLDSLLAHALLIDPADTLLLPVKGLLHLKIGDQAGAEETFRTNMELNPKVLSARRSWCDLLSFLEKWEELAEESGKAYGIFPSEVSFIESEIYARYNLKQWDHIIALCGKILSNFPDNKEKSVTAWSTMGDVHYMAGKRREAFKAYEKSLELDPDNIYVLNNYAYYLSLGGKKLKKAAAMSKKTVNAEPDNATYLDTYAWILFLQGKPEESKPLFKHAMLYGGKESVVILDHYAEVLFSLEEYDLAFVYWNRIKSMDKNDEIPGLEDKISKRQAQMKKRKK